MELLLGAGNDRTKHYWNDSLNVPQDWTHLVTLDIMDHVGADVVANLEHRLPFKDNSFDEIHAYEVLEHVGRQGDWLFFFAQFLDFWRVLKPNGVFVCTTPKWDSEWAWGDPGHTRVLTPGTFTWLDSKYRAEQNTSRTPYPVNYDFNYIAAMDAGGSIMTVLVAKK